MALVDKRYLEDDRIIVCRRCRTHLTSPNDLISREFQGQHGRASLYTSVYDFSICYSC